MSLTQVAKGMNKSVQSLLREGDRGRRISKRGMDACRFLLITELSELRRIPSVLIIAGSEDRITPAPVVRKIAKKYKAVSTYKEFENHAHWVVGERGWEEITEYVAGWLKQTLAEDG